MEQAVTDGRAAGGLLLTTLGPSNEKPFLQFLQMVGSGPEGLGESRSHGWVGREAGGHATGLTAGMRRESKRVASEPPGAAAAAGLTTHGREETTVLQSLLPLKLRGER